VWPGIDRELLPDPRFGISGAFMCGSYRTARLKSGAESLSARWYTLGRAEIFALRCPPAKIAALEMARSANAVIGPAKIADASDGNEPKEN